MVKKLLALSGLYAALFLPGANASVLTADLQSSAVSANASDFVGTLLSDTGLLPFVSSTFVSGTVEQRVYMESSGTLDFYYLISNSAASLDSIGRMTTKNFTNFSIAVSFLTIPTGFIPPTEADRSIAGDTIGFNFQGPNGNTLTPGGSSAWLEISTNATLFNLSGTTNVFDGGTGTVATYSPVPVPEPGAMALLGSGLLGLRLFSILRKQ